MAKRSTIDWNAIFASMVETGKGPRETARAFGLAPGTVGSAVWREKLHPGHGRLAGYVPRAGQAEGE